MTRPNWVRSSFSFLYSNFNRSSFFYRKDSTYRKVVGLVFASQVVLAFFIGSAFGQELTASYYTVKSCLEESGQYQMANGELLNDNNKTCASWDYPFGTLLLIRNTLNNKSVVVKVSDRGPAKRLYRKGRVIDLSKRAFSEIADLKQGIIPIKIKIYGKEVSK